MNDAFSRIIGPIFSRRSNEAEEIESPRSGARCRLRRRSLCTSLWRQCSKPPCSSRNYQKKTNYPGYDFRKLETKCDECEVTRKQKEMKRVEGKSHTESVDRKLEELESSLKSLGREMRENLESRDKKISERLERMTENPEGKNRAENDPMEIDQQTQVENKEQQKGRKIDDKKHLEPEPAEWAEKRKKNLILRGLSNPTFEKVVNLLEHYKIAVRKDVIKVVQRRVGLYDWAFLTMASIETAEASFNNRLSLKGTQFYLQKDLSMAERLKLKEEREKRRQSYGYPQRQASFPNRPPTSPTNFPAWSQPPNGHSWGPPQHPNWRQNQFMDPGASYPYPNANQGTFPPMLQPMQQPGRNQQYGWGY